LEDVAADHAHERSCHPVSITVHDSNNFFASYFLESIKIVIYLLFLSKNNKNAQQKH
jgi:hypothetical protein